jgi:ribosomal protein L18E
MKLNRDSIVEAGREVIKTVIETKFPFVFFRAFADEGSDADNKQDNKGGEGDESSKSAPVINYEDLIAKARKEEKDKQYKKIKKLEEDISSLTNGHNNDLLTIANLQQQLKAAEEKLTKTNSGDSEAVQTLKSQISNLEKEKKELEDKVAAYEKNPPASQEDIEKKVRAELETEYKVKNYRITKLAEFSDQILVPELVVGDTEEEIDKSITAAIERSNQIRKSLGVKDGEKKRTTPKSNPSVSGAQDHTADFERLATMDVRSKEYRELREKLGLR